jgi:hypothetical protein
MKTSTSGTYSMRPDQYLFTISGTNLSTVANMWWLAGYNRGSQDRPTYTATIDGVTYLVWDIRKTPYIAALNFWGDDEVVLQTGNAGAYSLACFGLQTTDATSFTSVISDISFYSPDELIDTYPELKSTIYSKAFSLGAGSQFEHNGVVYTIDENNAAAIATAGQVENAPASVFGYNVEQAATASTGDVNMDGSVDINDVILTINHVLGISSSSFHIEYADVSANGVVDVDDVVILINWIVTQSNGSSTDSNINIPKGDGDGPEIAD